MRQNPLNKRPTLTDFEKEVLKDPKFKMNYNALETEFALLDKFIKARKKAQCSQVELAERLDLQQPTIARLERGGYTTTSVSKLAQVADALGYKLKIILSPKKTTKTKKHKENIT